MDSNVTSAVAYLSATCEMCHVIDLLAPEAERARSSSQSPQPPRYLPREWLQGGYYSESGGSAASAAQE